MRRLPFICSAFGLLLLFTTPLAAQTISFISAPSGVGSGLQSADARARLSDSQHGGIFVRIATSDTLLALIAPNSSTVGTDTLEVFVSNGATDAFFQVQALEGVTGSVDVTASALGFVDQTIAVPLVQPALRLSGVPATIDVPDPEDAFTVQVGIANGTGTSLQSTQKVRVGGPGLTATVQSSDALAAELRTTTTSGSTVTIPILPGESSSPSTVVLGGVALVPVAAGTTEVSASIPGFAPTGAAVTQVTVNAGAITPLGLPANVGAGLITSQLRARLNGSAHGGVTVRVESADPASVLVSEGVDDPGSAFVDILVPDGLIDAKYYAHGIEGALGGVLVTISAIGFGLVSEAVNVEEPFFRIRDLTSATDVLDPDDPFRVEVGLPNSLATTIGVAQSLRPGGPGAVATLTSSDPLVGQLVTTTSTSDTVTVFIPPGEPRSPSTVATGGVAFDGIGEGVTMVRATIPGFTTTVAGFKDVTVSQPAISFLGVGGSKIGSGLQSTQVRARLGATQHGGTLVRIEVDDPSLGVVSADEDTLGAASLEIFVEDGSIDANFYVQALEPGTGILRMTATAPAFTSKLDSVEIVTPGIKITSLISTQDTLDPPDPFYAQIGVPFSTDGLSTQKVRAERTPLTVTFESLDPGIALLNTLADTAAIVQATIPPGDSASPTTPANGGVEFDGIAPGSVDVTVTAPGFDPRPSATRTVIVTSPTISMLPATAVVGAGLQASGNRARLSVTQHGGVTVTLVSSDPTRVRIAASSSEAGGESLQVFVPNGQIDANYVFEALDGTTGSVQISVEASGFIGAAQTVDVVQPAVDIAFLASTFDLSAADDPFRARVGLPNSGGTSLQTTQARRFGAPALVVNLTSSEPSTAELVTLAATGDVASVIIVPGESSSPTNVDTGGVALRPVGPGTSLIQATIPGFLLVGSSTKQITVTNDGIALPGVPAQIGAGLQTEPLVALLSDAQHGGVTLRIESSDPAALLVSGASDSEGTGALQIALPNGVGQATYFLQAIEGSTGSETVTASASGFPSNSVDVQLVSASLQVVALPDSADVNSPDQTFRIQAGIADATADSLVRLQARRAGSSPVEIELVVENPALARLVTQAATGDTVTVELAPGALQTEDTIGTGGVALDFVSPGVITVSASAAEFMATGASSKNVVITGQVVAVDDIPRAVVHLEQNTPNPFNPSTVIRFSLDARQEVRLDVLDLAGRRVATLVRSELEAGSHEATWRGLDQRGHRVASGVYLYRLRTGALERVRKMVLVK